MLSLLLLCHAGFEWLLLRRVGVVAATSRCCCCWVATTSRVTTIQFGAVVSRGVRVATSTSRGSSCCYVALLLLLGRYYIACCWVVDGVSDFGDLGFWLLLRMRERAAEGGNLQLLHFRDIHMRAVSWQPICQLRMVFLIYGYTRLSMFLKTWLYNIEHLPENYLSHGGSILGVKFLDPLAGLVVSGIILKARLETGYQSVLELVDAAIPAENLMSIRETILKVEGVKGCHRLRGRRAGSPMYLDVHIVPLNFLYSAWCLNQFCSHEACRSLCKFQFSFRVLSKDDIVAGIFTRSLARNLIVGVLALIFGSFVG
ncbi:hypothetical protein WN944_027094 [Citrus x changshan-huyou]|uniref:Cation efflux protein cytoplasmic domain-containing protein n=1 Tax=Citrus x changshan-huyou TaxID=2935761 RepID=A0AAP0LGW5_9ROSI